MSFAPRLQIYLLNQKMKTVIRRPLFLLVIPFVFATYLNAQNTTVHLTFKPIFNNSIYLFDDTTAYTKDSLKTKIEVLKFYISNLSFLKNNRVLAKEKKAYLIDGIKLNNIVTKINKKINFDAIQFNLGIDSFTNVSGALGGDLDPTKGMYWTWQNGYINLILEGQSYEPDYNKKQFQFHLGGYTYPYNCLQTVLLKTKNKHIQIGLDMALVMQTIALEKSNKIMSPSLEAFALLNKIANLFFIIPND